MKTKVFVIEKNKNKKETKTGKKKPLIFQLRQFLIFFH